MAAIHVQTLAYKTFSYSLSSSKTHKVSSALHVAANTTTTTVKGLPKLTKRAENTYSLIMNPATNTSTHASELCNKNGDNDDPLIHKIYAILEAVADRAEMHSIIGEQRDNWNHLLSNAINSITITASLMAGISSMAVMASEAMPSFMAMKLSSVLLFTASAGIMMVVNKIQPSQLAEEQRNSSRLWKQLQRSIETKLSLRSPTEQDVDEAMAKVLGLEKAYPLPLLPGMLEKFPKKFQPAKWWPKMYNTRQTAAPNRHTNYNNGWNKELEQVMQGARNVLRAKDEQEYMTVGSVALNINRSLATAGPMFAAAAALGSALIGTSPALGGLPVVLGVCGGAFAMLSNVLEHSGQVGMVVELFRNCAGYYKRLEEEIEVQLSEDDLEKRENGKVFEMRMALQLGRSLSEIRELSVYASSSYKEEEIKEFAGKLF